MRIPSREVCIVQYIGRLWMPGIVAVQEQILTAHDLENVGEWTRENVALWLDSHSPDFAEIIDFRADFSRAGRDWESDWEDEESALMFAECMF